MIARVLRGTVYRRQAYTIIMHNFHVKFAIQSNVYVTTRRRWLSFDFVNIKTYAAQVCDTIICPKNWHMKLFTSRFRPRNDEMNDYENTDLKFSSNCDVVVWHSVVWSRQTNNDLNISGMPILRLFNTCDDGSFLNRPFEWLVRCFGVSKI